MPYDFVADGFHTKKLCSRLYLQTNCDFRQKTVFLSPIWGLRGNVRCSS